MSGEAYVKRFPGGFSDKPAQVSPIDSQFLNAVEAALGRLLGVDPTNNYPVIWVAANGRYEPKLIANAHVDPSAGIVRSKLDFGPGLVNGDIAPSAGIAKSKLAPLDIVNADVNATAAIAYSKLALANSIVSGDLVDGTIQSADLADTTLEGRKINWHYGTTPPGSPLTGDIWILVDNATTPTFTWLLRYNAASGNADKWEALNGSAFAEVATSEVTSSTSYVALTTAGPSITIPRPGVYVIEVGARMFNTTVNSDYMSFDIGATAAVDADAATGGDSANPHAHNAVTQKTIAAASTALVSKYKSATGTATFAKRYMRVTPMRVS